jgi:hypothetical protein
MAIKKPGSKKEQEIENKMKEYKKGQIRTAKKKKKDKDPEAPYSTPLPGAPKGHNIARKRQGPPPVNV